MSQPSTEQAAAPVRVRKHTAWEDAQGLVSAVLVASLGVSILKAGHLISGGTPGVALLLSHVTGWSFGSLLFLVNLPFYWLAVKRMGWEFTIKTFCAVLACGFVTDRLPGFVGYSEIAPVYAAVYGGLLLGVGILMFVRHRASMGGLNVFALYIQEKGGWNAGKVQMAFDACVMGVALFVLDDKVQVLYSLLCIVVLNLALWFNHRPDRYLTR